MNPPVHFERSNRIISVGEQRARAFTLIELFVVLGTLAVLALVLVPALAGTRMESWRLQCQNNLRQLQVGMQLFTQDRGDMFPPACHASSTLSRNISWDSWIYQYISGGRSVTINYASKGFYAFNPNDAASLGVAPGLPVMVCPVDAQLPKVNWMRISDTLQIAPKTYEMISTGKNWGVDLQVDPLFGKYPLPDLNQPNRMGVGIYWQAPSGSVDWDAKGYKTSVVKDPGGTIMLCEDASSQCAEGGQWPCAAIGPYSSSGGSWSSLYQIDAAAPTDSARLYAGSYSEGQLLYPAHGNRFNYLFHDGHVAPLRVEDTVGAGTLSTPKGMWTVVPGD
jgi:prepilin-type processing-associated H-X9-DG protein